MHPEESANNTGAIDVKTKSILDGRITINDKLTLAEPTPEERGKGGVHVTGADGVQALEVLARVPRDLVIASVDLPPRAREAVTASRTATWATALTAATLAAWHPTEEEARLADGGAVRAKREWIASWGAGGWGRADDLGEDIAGDVAGTLLATGSDNDHNIYAKFRMPCHPAVFKASKGLEFLTKCTEEESRAALTARGSAYRSMKDALQTLVLETTARPHAKGTARTQRCWDVADTLDRVLSRATALQLDGDETGGRGDGAVHAVVPIHERLGHSLRANTKLLALGDEVLLVAARDISAGEAVTRDYAAAPRLANDDVAAGSALHLLLQFGLPPSAWPSA